MEQRVTLITLGVADLERSIGFYRDGLGWVASSSSQEGEIAFFQLNGLVLGLCAPARSARDPQPPPSTTRATTGTSRCRTDPVGPAEGP